MSEWMKDRAALHCQGWAFTSEQSIRDLIEESYQRGLAARDAEVARLRSSIEVYADALATPKWLRDGLHSALAATGAKPKTSEDGGRYKAERRGNPSDDASPVSTSPPAEAPQESGVPSGKSRDALRGAKGEP